MSEMGMEEAKRNVCTCKSHQFVQCRGANTLGSGWVCAEQIDAASRLEPMSAPELSGAALYLAVVRKRWADARLIVHGDGSVSVISEEKKEVLAVGATELLALRGAAEKVLREGGCIFPPHMTDPVFESICHYWLAHQPAPQPVESAGELYVDVPFALTLARKVQHWFVHGMEGSKHNTVVSLVHQLVDTLASTPKPDARVAELEWEHAEDMGLMLQRALNAEAKSAHLARQVETLRAALEQIEQQTVGALYGTRLLECKHIARKALADTNAGGEEAK